jgi:anti-anti-sigma factor
MNVKTDTKEKFTVVKPTDADITAEMSAELKKILTELLNSEQPNVVVNLEMVSSAADELIDVLAEMHEIYYQDDHSFVVCGFPKALLGVLTEKGLDDIINLTPTESEAWDMVQMEEIERELLNGEDF